MVLENNVSQVEEFDSYLGCSIPDQIDICPPIGLRESKGIRTRDHNKIRMRRKRKIKGCHASARHANKLGFMIHVTAQIEHHNNAAKVPVPKKMKGIPKRKTPIKKLKKATVYTACDYLFRSSLSKELLHDLEKACKN